MKSRILFLMALALALSVEAVPVTAVDAAKAGRAWAAREGRLGVRLGRAVERTDRHVAANGDAFFAVKLQGGGTVFVSGDTEDAPVIAFTGSAASFAEIDPKSPLWALLNRDRELRVAARPRLQSALQPAGGLQALGAANEEPSGAEANADEWAALLEEAKSLPPPNLPRLGAGVEPYSYAAIGDVRVAPLLQTKWAQAETDDGRACMNYFTPNGPDPAAFAPGDPDNAVCGCVATATAQVMFYHRYPSAELPSVASECRWNDTNKLALATQGGAFAWDLMPLNPNEDTSVSDEGLQALGHLASDVGIALHMGYNDLNAAREPSGESGAYAFSIAGTLMKTFGYGNAVYCDLEDALEGAKVETAAKIYQHALYSNFDAGLPVLVGLTGHQVVGDGYGYVDGRDYVHLNMGWAGQCDFWYRFPEVKYSLLSEMSFQCVNYNVFPEGGATQATLSGRVLDVGGNPVGGLSVKVRAAGADEIAAETVTSASGVWGVVLPAGRYDVEVEKSGFVATDAKGIRLDAPVTTEKEYNGVSSWTGADGKKIVLLKGKAPSVLATSALGNVWGVTQTLYPAKAVVCNGADPVAYCDNLDDALKAANGLADARVEIWEPLALGGVVTNAANCLIVATKGPAAESAVTCAAGAKIVVAEGASLTLSNVVMTAAAGAPVEVVAGGRLRLGGAVDVGALETADGDGLEVFAPLETSGIRLACATAAADGDAIGAISGGDFLAISNTVGRLLKADDDDMSGLAVEDGRKIVWARQPCDRSVAEAGVVIGGVTNYYLRLERVLSDYLDVADEILVLKDCAVTAPYGIGRDVRFAFADGVAVSAGPKAGFAVTNGTLTVENATFGDYRGAGLFVVDGGAVNLEGCVFTNVVSSSRYSGVLQVAAGSARVSRCLFDGCRIPDEVADNGYGAGIWVKGGAALEFLSSTIVNGFAKSYGGGIYADKGASVTIGGAGTVIASNQSGNSATDNIYVANANVQLLIGEEMSGERCVGVRFYGKNSAGSLFASFAEPPTPEAAAHTAAAFFSDFNPELAADVSGNALCWVAPSADDHAIDDPADAVAAVASADGVKYYPTIEYALASVTEDGATVRILKDCTLAGAVTVTNAVTLTSASGAFTVERTAGVSVKVEKVGALTLKDVTFANATSLAAVDSCRLFDVNGGSLTLKDGATIRNVVGSRVRVESAVYVHDGGVFRMEEGSLLADCRNLLSRQGDAAGHGGAIVSDRATLELFGGTVESSSAYRYGGGILAGNMSTVRISSAMTIVGNTNLNEEASNLTVSENSTLELVGALTGRIGIYPSLMTRMTPIFGSVTAALDDEALTNSAYRFTNDLTGAYGVPARRANGAAPDTLLIWSRAFDKNGLTMVDTADGPVAYRCIGDIPINEIPVYPTPIAFTEIVRDNEAKTCTVTFTNLVRGCWYSLYATNSLVGGFPLDAAVQTPVTNFQAEADGPFTFTFEADDTQLFWRATADEGVVYP